MVFYVLLARSVETVTIRPGNGQQMPVISSMNITGLPGELEVVVCQMLRSPDALSG